jgi:hypothetical protein
VRIDTVQGEGETIERLSRRDSKSLAAFIVSLAQDDGPVGEHVRTFVLGDEVDQVSTSIEERIGSIEGMTEYEYRHQRGAEVGQRLRFILDAVERLVLPVDPRRALELLVRFFESDGVAMESCGDHDQGVTCAFERAALLIGLAVTELPRVEVEATLRTLLEKDSYGVRGVPGSVGRGPGG